ADRRSGAALPGDDRPRRSHGRACVRRAPHPSLRSLFAAAAIPGRVIDAFTSRLTSLRAMTRDLEDADLFAARAWDSLVRGVSPCGGLESRLVPGARPVAAQSSEASTIERPRRRDAVRPDSLRRPTAAAIPARAEGDRVAVAALLERAQREWPEPAGDASRISSDRGSDASLARRARGVVSATAAVPADVRAL